MAVPGLVPVNTPAGILMMTPDMAAQVQPYVDPVLGDPELVRRGALPPTEAPLQGGPPAGDLAPIQMSEMPAGASMSTPEQDRQQLATAMGTTDTSQLAPQSPGPSSPPPSAMVTGSPAGPSALEQLLANPPSTMASSTTKRTSIPITGPNRDAIDAANQGTLAAEQKAAEAIGAQADAATAIANKEAEQAEQMARADAARRIRQDAVINAARQKRDQAWAKVPDKPDPNRWDKLGGGGRILAAVSLMLGGISQGITGRENPAAGMINSIIQEDLEMQRAEIELAQQAAQRADNEYQDALDTYGDPILAEKQVELTGYGAVLKEIQARMQAAQGEAQKAAAAAGIAEVQGEIARLNNEMDGRVGELVTQSQTNPGYDIETWKTQVGVLADRQAAANDPFHGMDDRSKRDAVARLVVLPSGQKGFAPTEKEGTAMRQAKVAYDQYSENVSRLLELAEQGDNLTFEGRGEMEALIQDNAIAIKNIKELGALVGADWGIVDPLSGKGVKDLIAPGAKQMIRTSKKRMGDELTKKWGTLLDAPFSTNLLNPGGGMQELPYAGD